MKDPMMVDDTDTANRSETALSVKFPSGKLKIEPIHPDLADKPVEPEAPAEAAQSAAASENDASAEPEKPTTSQPEPVNTDDTGATSVDKLKETSKDSDAAALEQEAKRAAELQKLAESRKYYLPINQIEKRRNKRNTVLGVLLIIILAIAWADVSLDAGIISIPGIKAPTHFFK